MRISDGFDPRTHRKQRYISAACRTLQTESVLVYPKERCDLFPYLVCVLGDDDTSVRTDGRRGRGRGCLSGVWIIYTDNAADLLARISQEIAEGHQRCGP